MASGKERIESILFWVAKLQEASEDELNHENLADQLRNADILLDDAVDELEALRET